MDCLSQKFDRIEQQIKLSYNQLYASQYSSYIDSSNDRVIIPDSVSPSIKIGDYLFDDSVEIKNIIATGGQATLYHGYYKEDGKDYAVKYYENYKDDYEGKEQIENEFKLSNRISHKNIIQVYAIDTKTEGDFTQCFILMELIEMNLYNYIMSYEQENNNKHLPIKIVKEITRNILYGLSCLHNEYSIIHLDLKPQNILVSKDLSDIRITDFGISKSLENTQTLKNRGNNGTKLYMSPEMFAGKPYGYDADIWALGCIVYQMVSGMMPYTSKYNKEIQFIKGCHLGVSSPLELADDDILDIFYDKANRSLLDFVQKCWRGNNLYRPTVDELLEHPFVKLD